MYVVNIIAIYHEHEIELEQPSQPRPKGRANIPHDLQCRQLVICSERHKQKYARNQKKD